MAESLNIDLVMPDQDLYTSCLDRQPTNQNGTQSGDRESLLTWLQAQDEECDIFIISLDQLLSGGLMNSRAMGEMTDLVFEEGNMTEYEVIDYIKTLSQDNQVYIIDSVMRLATSVDYDGFSLEHYYATRNYGLVARPELTGDALTVENIVENYRLAQDGTEAVGLLNQTQAKLLLNQKTVIREYIQADQLREALTQEETTAYSTVRESLPAEVENSLLKNYLQIRERKLRLTDYALTQLSGETNVHYLLGVDDSSEGNNIQSNEIRLFQQELLGEDDQLISSLDGLAQVALCKVFLANQTVTMPSVTVTYLGDQTDTVQSYNCNTPKEMVDQALDYYGASEVPEDGDLSVVVVTPTAENADSLLSQLVSLLNENQQNQIPTILVDLTNGQMENFNSILIENVNLGMLLSYSGSNELPNSITMALSQGLARYAALTLPNFLTSESQKAHLENLATAFTVEFAYLDGAYSAMNRYFDSLDIPSGNYGTLDDQTLSQVETELTQQVAAAGAELKKNLQNSPYISSLAPYTLSSIRTVKIQHCSYPFLRNIEIQCQIKVTLSSKTASLGTYHGKYINGVSETSFQPNAYITREAAVTMLIGSMGITASDADVACPEDVDPWAWNNVYYAKEKGYVKGYPDGSFCGRNNITRAEFCSMIMQFAEKEHMTLSGNNTTVFQDVDAGSKIWYVTPIYTMARAGLVVGYGGLFRPNDPITRAEAVTIFNRLWNRQEDLSDSLLSASRFLDVTAPWQLEQVQEASISHFCK
jgi:hypothetical protein